MRGVKQSGKTYLRQKMSEGGKNIQRMYPLSVVQLLTSPIPVKSTYVELLT